MTKEKKVYLVIVDVPGERDQRMKVVKTRGEAAAHVMKIKMFVQGVKAEIFMLGEAVEVFS